MAGFAAGSTLSQMTRNRRHRWTKAGDKDLAITSDVLNVIAPQKSTEKGASRIQKRRERSCTFAATRCVSLALR
jgi:hypothetical protein